MLRSAEEILRDVYNENDSQEDNLQLAITLNPSLELIKEAINQARKEAIEECAKSAEAEMKLHRFINDDWYAEVDKQSIIKLINQLK